ncbi:MAG: vWA domain-containing protein [Archangium sp.]|nr:vWA domain-containing protein [Archangium sp.]MDP3155084.1 vWA domain-containing protein [Archangium sp.]MDP3572064.1 vWA domain-containing protein [Archangium sp.]
MRALLFVFAAGAALSLSACSQARCTENSQCASSQVCVPSGICLTACQTAAQCGDEQVCNPRGVCVSGATGCAVSTDCAAGQICAPGGMCMTGGTSMVDAGPVSCGGQKFGSTATEANILIVLDHSCSMQELIAGSRSKWEIATAAVRNVTSQNTGNAKLRFGLQLFSLQPSMCNPGRIDVPVGPSTMNAISNALPANAEGNTTPIGAALSVAANSGQLTDATRANYVLLLADGMENCNGAPVTEVEGLFSRGVRTYSVGFGSDVDETRLTQMAIRGGTARASTPRYFQADSPTDLEAALAAIASGAASCDFTLTSTPPDASKLYVAIDGQFFPRDPARIAGWDYQAAGNRVTLYGPACDIVSQRPGARVSIIYGCPDDGLTERGPGGSLDAGIVETSDGGFAWPSDAGIPEIN